MITQGRITVYNKRLGANRRDLYYPTGISSASYAEKRGSSHTTGETEEGLAYRLRIPQGAVIEGGRQYTPESSYRLMSDSEASNYWTLAKLDLITRGEAVVSSPSTEQEIRTAAKEAGKDVIIIAEYADNTDRGSPSVKHWRIGGR